jgi:transcriptional regulator with XRE-family HTH domain|tara:strand:+ start:3025 stop:3276 length:252 start_codon:yes stop_codon:yes gene_type:complete
MRGYSQIVIEANQKALLVVEGDKPAALRLGEMCISKRYAAAAVAKKLNVSRQTVYDWFSGKAMPQPARETEIKELIEELSRLI